MDIRSIIKPLSWTEDSDSGILYSLLLPGLRFAIAPPDCSGVSDGEYWIWLEAKDQYKNVYLDTRTFPKKMSTEQECREFCQNYWDGIIMGFMEG